MCVSSGEVTWKRTIHSICLLATWSVFVASCGTLTNAQDANGTPPSLLATSTPTDSGVTLSQTANPNPPTPVLPANLQDGGLFQTDTAGCALPCWQGVTVGQSNLDDVAEVFYDTFGFDKSVDITSLPLPDYHSQPSPGEIAVVHAWGYQAEGPHIEFDFRFERGSEVLTQLSVTFWDVTGPSLQEVIGSLGVPNRVFINLQKAQVTSTAILLIVYDEGMVFFFRDDGTVETPSGPLVICLNESMHLDEVNLVDPLPHDPSNFSPVQERVIVQRIEDWGLKPIEEEVSMSIEQFTEQITTEGDACVSENPLLPE